jgi:hypothetical protein
MPDRLWQQEGGLTRRQQETAPGEYSDQAYVVDAWSAAIALGRAYIVSCGRVVLTVAGNVRAVVQNPATSQRNVTVLALTAFATAAGWPQVYLDPTAGVPTAAARPHLALRPSSEAPVAAVRVDTNATTALSGGTDTGLVIPVPANNPRELQRIGKVIPPGEALGLNMPFATSADVTFALYLIQE